MLKGEMVRIQKWWFTHFKLAIIYLALTVSEKNTFQFGTMSRILMTYKIMLKNQYI
jgi:hypothetical protein